MKRFKRLFFIKSNLKKKTFKIRNIGSRLDVSQFNNPKLDKVLKYQNFDLRWSKFDLKKKLKNENQKSFSILLSLRGLFKTV